MRTQAFLSRHQDDWTRSWRALAPLPADATLLRSLCARYDEPHRHYHTLQHLDACLRHLASLRSLAQRPDEVAFALWFHDAIYDIGAADNERRSADWARTALLEHGGAPDVADRIHALIMVTRHDQPPQSIDQQVLLDVDLAILGAPPDVFAAYEQQIVREYHAVPTDAFRSNRRRILQGFLDRPRIYHTEAFLQAREAQARSNLARSVALLQG